MSLVGTVMGLPVAGDRMLLADSIRMRASAWASADSGRWTAIWSPSKSALKAVQTRGWIWMALPSTSTGSKAWIPRRCRVGARLRSKGCSSMTSSRTSHTCGRAQVEQALQPVVAVDHPAVEVVEVGGGEAPPVELHHGAQVGRDDRDGVQDHGPGVVHPPPVVVAAVEGGHDLQPLDGLLLALGRQRAPA